MELLFAMTMPLVMLGVAAYAMGKRVDVYSALGEALGVDRSQVAGMVSDGDVSGEAAAEAILADPLFATLKAVQNGAVYGTPNAPFSWVDRPPGPNRIVGMRWLSGLIYPEYLDYDVDEAVREFFQLFYHVELTDEQLTQLYNRTL